MARRATDRRRASWVALGLAPALLVGAVAGVDRFGVDHRGTDHSGVNLTAGSEITLIGHGHGHGRGMGQWGAFGYAKKGWTSTQILSHFYGGTTAGKVDNAEVTVILTDQSSVNVHADAGMKVGDRTVAPGQAISLSGATATITAGCGGPAVDSVALADPVVSPITPGTGRPATEQLKFCGSNAAYRGSIGFQNGHVINKVNVDDYVRGVIPRESLPAWADQGGAEALKAQAVAARSYALASQRLGKPIDDTQSSQVYGGVSGEDPRTNTAADATAGQVLNGRDGQPAFTEFSASTGGYSAGVDFPAVPDEGDVGAPDHDWTATVSPGSVGSAFGVGTATDVRVIEANGLGAENGRATKVRITGTGGSVDATGEDVRVKLQLKSSWFTVQGQPKPTIVAPPAGVGTGAPGSTGLPDFLQLPDGTGVLPGLQDLLDLATSAIAGKFGDLGSAGGVLGPATSQVMALAGTSGAMQKFRNGNIYFTPQTGAHALVGSALTDFVAKGAEKVVGFPLTDLLSGLATGASAPAKTPAAAKPAAGTKPPATARRPAATKTAPR
ncbi:SpoIID/LytB domain-containing protein [Williamsia sterculiae]|uniref:SpoIID/LytB domain protein n=1 Tax=Williamsia sterculiae TaxID=1344003 RepID=A0A1N7H8J4_9NOCA|nr:SpoIID/LytB domain-containing protein [Williamsia sterculiae]SIS21205.1 SpoIID/LytB domain protein [Williamsia sterculiae]